jgi:hypothetical protein
MKQQLDRIEQMLRYLIIKPRLEEIEKQYSHYNQLAQQTNMLPPPPKLYEEMNRLRLLLPNINELILELFRETGGKK